MIAYAVILAALLGVFGWQQHKVDVLTVSVASETLGRSQDRAAEASAAASAAVANLNETQRRESAQSEIANESQRFTTRANADAAMSANASARLRARTVAATGAYCRARPSDPAASGVSPPASSPGDLLADVQRRISDAAGSISAYADILRPAVEQCAGSYDALTK